jgi:elongation factor Ts
MVEIDAKRVMDLRRKTGAPMMDCKAALQEASGDETKATEILRKRGLQSADARAGRDAGEGRIFSYVHHNGRIGVLLDLACETDFVARNPEFAELGHQICLHVAAMRPRYLDKEAVDAKTFENEVRILTEQAKQQMSGKPADVIDKAVQGRIAKLYGEICLLEQPWVHDGAQTVGQVVKALGAKTGENVYVRRFHRIEIGG